MFAQTMAGVSLHAGPMNHTDVAMQIEGARILLVDDYHPRILIFELLFDCLKCTLDIVQTTTEALSKIAEDQYALVLINVNLRSDDGLEGTKSIRKFEREHNREALMIIGIMAYDDMIDPILCKIAGMDDCISQFITPSYLYEKLSGFKQV